MKLIVAFRLFTNALKNGRSVGQQAYSIRHNPYLTKTGLRQVSNNKLRHSASQGHLYSTSTT